MTTIHGNTNIEWWTFKLEVSEGDISIENNTSPVTVAAYIGRKTSGSYMEGAKISCPVSVTGVASKTISYKLGAGERVNVAAGAWLKIGSVTFDAVPHNDDGSKTVVVSASFTNNISPANGKASGSVPLTTIPRASQPSCITWPEHTQNVGNFGDTISIHMNRKSSKFTHTVRYQFGENSGTIATGVETGTKWTIPVSLMNLIPNTSTGSGTIYVDTYDGTKKIGTKYCGFTAKVPASVIPTCSLQVLDATDIQEKYGNLVKGKSKLKINLNGTGVYSSTISSYLATVGYSGVSGVTSYSNKEITTGVLEHAGTVTVKAKVTDSRGDVSTERSASFTVIDYEKPRITSLVVHRCDEDGTENENGEFVEVKFSAQISPLNNKNSAAYKLIYTNNTTKAETDVPFTDLNKNYSPSDYAYIFEADTGSSYTVVIEAIDDFGAVPLGTAVSTGFALYNVHKSGTALAFGKIAEEEKTLENALALKQIGNRYCMSTAGVVNQAGYVCMARLTHIAANADTPITFVFTRRLEASPMTVHVQFKTDSTTVDPQLKGITYEGSNYGAFLVKVDTSVWDLYVQKVSAYDTITLQDWYTTRTIKGRLNVTFPANLVSELPQGLLGWYRATPFVSQSILDAFYPVGYVLILYSHADPNQMYAGTTWVRITNSFLWGCDEDGDIGVTGGEKTHTLTVNELPSHNHGGTYSGDASGAKTHAWLTANGSSMGYAKINTGGGAAHNNMPPYVQVSIWRRTA